MPAVVPLLHADVLLLVLELVALTLASLVAVRSLSVGGQLDGLLLQPARFVLLVLVHRAVVQPVFCLPVAAPRLLLPPLLKLAVVLLHLLGALQAVVLPREVLRLLRHRETWTHLVPLHRVVAVVVAVWLRAQSTLQLLALMAAFQVLLSVVLLPALLAVLGGWKEERLL